MILLGTGVVIFESVFGIIVVLAGILIVFLHYGILIDFEESRYKEFLGLLGLKFGKWENLPHLEYISLTKSRYSQKVGLRAANTTLEGVLYKGNLRINDQERILVIQSPGKDKVLKKLKYLAKKLDLRVLDCTKSENVWVEL